MIRFFWIGWPKRFVHGYYLNFPVGGDQCVSFSVFSSESNDSLKTPSHSRPKRVWFSFIVTYVYEPNKRCWNVYPTRFPNTSVLPLPLCCCKRFQITFIGFYTLLRYLLIHITNWTNGISAGLQIFVHFTHCSAAPADSRSDSKQRLACDGGVFVQLVQPIKCFLQPGPHSNAVVWWSQTERRFKRQRERKTDWIRNSIALYRRNISAIPFYGKRLVARVYPNSAFECLTGCITMLYNNTPVKHLCNVNVTCNVN